MDTKRILKLGLFFYECIRTIILIMLLPLTAANVISWAAFAAPLALFPLMTLFIYIDSNRYKNFLPLYIAGKTIGFLAFLGWFLFTGRGTIFQWAFEGSYLIALGIALYINKEG